MTTRNLNSKIIDLIVKDKQDIEELSLNTSRLRPQNDVEKRLDSEASIYESPIMLKTAKSNEEIKETPEKLH